MLRHLLMVVFQILVLTTLVSVGSLTDLFLDHRDLRHLLQIRDSLL